MDTIAAISTPRGTGGIAVIRLSGPDAIAIASRHLSTLGGTTPHLFRINGSVLDQVVTTLYRTPHSYTGDDTVEFSCHGSLYVQQTLLQALLDSGARLAEPGEFTRRAFLNGKLNLSQAEAVADLIDSTNAAAHTLALSQLRGGYAQELEQLRQQLVDLAALLELELDFSDEDVEFADRSRLLTLTRQTATRVGTLRQSFRLGNALKRGIPVAIVGRPNAGKSSLLNALLHDNRALVSEIPGTTRDTIEETFVLEGTAFRIIDTAGLRQSLDPIEQMGIQRTRDTAARADIILYIHDATQPPHLAQQDLQQLPFDGKHLLLIYNKSDLPGAASPTPPGAIALSAKTGQGLDRLTAALTAIATDDQSQAPDVLVTNARHYEALGHVGQALQQVADGLQNGLPADLVVIDLRDALHHLGTITGQVTSDEVLGTIFSRFCIGK